MAKHSDGKPKPANKEDKFRAEAIEKLRPLTPKWLKHIEQALDAVIPCNYCDAEGKASKVDESGACIKCHGLKVIANDDQRNWAAEEIGARIAPKPKSVEATVDDKREFEELSEKAANLSDKTLNEIMKELNPGFYGADRPSND